MTLSQCYRLVLDACNGGEPPLAIKIPYRDWQEVRREFAEQLKHIGQQPHSFTHGVPSMNFVLGNVAIVPA